MRLHRVEGGPELPRAATVPERHPEAVGIAPRVMFKQVRMPSSLRVEHFSPSEAVTTLGAAGIDEAAEVVFAEGAGDFFADGVPVGRGFGDDR